jgi:catechol 2,3-dioxygenase-like lactoylglutathione lyase family enzyme
MIQHVTRQIRPSQLSECLRFYAILGFEPIVVPPGLEGRAVWLAGPESSAGAPPGPDLHLMFDDEARPESGHVAFVLAGYEATVARLREAGFEVQARREHWGSPRSYVRDPCSNLVELMEWAPGERRE